MHGKPGVTQNKPQRHHAWDYWVLTSWGKSIESILQNKFLMKLLQDWLYYFFYPTKYFNYSLIKQSLNDIYYRKSLHFNLFFLTVNCFYCLIYSSSSWNFRCSFCFLAEKFKIINRKCKTEQNSCLNKKPQK